MLLLVVSHHCRYARLAQLARLELSIGETLAAILREPCKAAGGTGEGACIDKHPALEKGRVWRRLAREAALRTRLLLTEHVVHNPEAIREHIELYNRVYARLFRDAAPSWRQLIEAARLSRTIDARGPRSMQLRRAATPNCRRLREAYDEWRFWSPELNGAERARYRIEVRLGGVTLEAMVSLAEGMALAVGLGGSRLAGRLLEEGVAEHRLEGIDCGFVEEAVERLLGVAEPDDSVHRLLVRAAALIAAYGLAEAIVVGPVAKLLYVLNFACRLSLEALYEASPSLLTPPLLEII